MKLKFLNLLNGFILLTILVVWLITSTVISPYLHFSFQQIGFFTGFEFFKNYSTYPGGIADYLGVFIFQFFSLNTIGSLLIVAIAALQGFIALTIVRSLAGELKLRYTIFAAILLFGVIVLGDYRYPYYATIRLLFAYIFTLAFLIVNSRWPKLSAQIWIIFATLLFYIAGGSALFVFALSSSILFIITHKQKIWLLVPPYFLLIAGLLPYLGYKYLFQITLSNIYKITMVKPPEQLAYVPGMTLYIYYSILPVVLLGVLIFIHLKKKEPIKQPVSQSKKSVKAAPAAGFYQKMPISLLLQVSICTIFGYFLFVKSLDPIKKKLITLEYYAENEEWEKILTLAEEIELYDFRVNFQVNRAYSHLGQLPDMLFNYPQLLGSFGLFVDPAMMIGSSSMPTSDLYFDLGFMNESQHWAFEAETLLPNSPRILKRLVMINLVNRKYNLAGQFLNVLDKNILCRDWVRKYEKYVSDTTLAAMDKVIVEKRRFTPKKAIISPGTIEGLKLLIQTNKNNRMAYDYLLAFDLLDSNLSEFIEYLQYYKQYYSQTMPRAWEEGLLICIMKHKSFPDFVTEETVSKNCRQRIVNFNKVMKSFNNNLPAAKNTLLQYFGNSYLYYIAYLSSKVTNVLEYKTPIR